MKVSLITATYNSARTLQATLDSVAKQSYVDVEHILIDGASTDETKGLIEAYQNRHKVVVSETDLGIYDAMNKGISLASGDIIGILNSDDVYYDDEVLSEVVRHFKADQDLRIVYGDLIYVRSDDMSKVVRKWISKPYYPKFFEHGHVPPHPTVFLRREVYETAGLFDLQYKLASDYEFMLRIFKKYKFRSLYIPRIMVKMRLGGATNNSIKNILNGNQEIVAAWKNNGFRLPVFFLPLKLINRLRQFI